MRIPKHLEARLAQLEARVRYLPDPEAERERERLSELYFYTWLIGGCLEDIPKKDRDRKLWENVCFYGPVVLEMVWTGALLGRDEFLEDGIDFTRVEGIDEDDVRAYLDRTSDPKPYKP